MRISNSNTNEDELKKSFTRTNRPPVPPPPVSLARKSSILPELSKSFQMHGFFKNSF